MSAAILIAAPGQCLRPLHDGRQIAALATLGPEPALDHDTLEVPIVPLDELLADCWAAGGLHEGRREAPPPLFLFVPYRFATTELSWRIMGLMTLIEEGEWR